MLTLENVCWKPDGRDAVLKGIDLQLKPGKLTVVTGPNGGGKTSLAKVIAGLNQVSSGRISLGDIDITEKDITERAKLGISYAFQQPVRFKGITVRSLLDLAAGGDVGDENVCQLMAKVGLCTKDYIDREINASLSGGEIKRIEIASVLARRDSKVLIFDEPEAGIDLWSFTGLIETFEDLKKEQDKALLVISHQERLLEIADEIAVIVDGKVRISGPSQEIMPQLLAGEKAGICPIGKEW
ncbi:ATP-binding cassette domain-containing protein [Anaerovoracaceae bacterium 41-7]|jgi:Fe-S cluster assembly ATP-binding protein|uniref:ATP-binding cassette domain-containing protein n=1 Tax=Anaerotruncus colihominis TaxID=169435 RepID=A0A845QSB5_9FIRM|nr:MULTISPECIES: ATP-binding cassette domain-containing protein [Clostridia]MCI9476440.1 ATP-binding cassette domain-containing protein [Emergencia sp.]MCI9640551.1 ATP-binding cassette domain-containing protein [Emergencia sp.]NBH62898.1 ATP-binding cassette domain-containing protein [Anaerotruncus colihominis]NCE99594.1 ATP-binding cassette domain-containing protein [Emergencia sp. 1XD21-10]NCF03552.1 ATP-binding cassette domain-containing protein [Anaerotruncus sp. 80]